MLELAQDALKDVDVVVDFSDFGIGSLSIVAVRVLCYSLEPFQGIDKALYRTLCTGITNEINSIVVNIGLVVADDWLFTLQLIHLTKNFRGSGFHFYLHYFKN